MAKRRLVFVTGTRADFGKMAPLIERVVADEAFETHVFVTGMHLLATYGMTVHEIEKAGFPNIFTFENQGEAAKMDVTLANTITGFSRYVAEIKPDLIVVHGDRVEPLAASIVGALNNIRVAHLEGGEISGTVDELLRHAISKLSHVHFVSNAEAANRLVQMGERRDSIFEIGSPDIDVMLGARLPDLGRVRARYDIAWDDYAVLIYHPVTTELDRLAANVDELFAAAEAAGDNFVVIYPNNDEGSRLILERIEARRGRPGFKILPSMRFEYFLALLKHAKYILGNSSAGIREAGVFGVPAVNVGSRQQNRARAASIFHAGDDRASIAAAIGRAREGKFAPESQFGDGKSAERFLQTLRSNAVWAISRQKQFVDLKDVL